MTSVCVAMKTRLPRTPFSACLRFSMLQCVAECYSMLQCDAVRVAMNTRPPHTPFSACLSFSMLPHVAVCCSALQCVTVCCSDED